MTRRIGLPLLATALLAAISATAEASIVAMGPGETVGSWRQTFAGFPNVAFDTIEVRSGGDGDYAAAVFEPAALRRFGTSNWTAEPGTTTSDTARGSRVTSQQGQAFVFDIYFSTNINQSLEFDIVAFDSLRDGAVDLSEHLDYIVAPGAAYGYWEYTFPASQRIAFVPPVPEPASFVVWSGILSCCVGLGLRNRWRKKLG